ncbi:MAG: baseplate J/gp47 family protein [Planctomycetia bacterium]
MAAKLYTFVVKSPQQIRDDGLRTLRAGLIARGIPNPNVQPNSDFYAEFTAFANELAVVESNAVIKADAIMPDTATDEDLAERAAMYGLAKRPAGGSVGNIVFSATAASLVTTGEVLTDGAGLSYEVTVGGTYSDGDLIPIAAVSLGEATNLEEGSSLRWQTAPTFSAQTALVSVGGLVNGTPAEDDEDLRERVLAYIQDPPAGDNASQVAIYAEDSAPAVQKAFVYPAVQGPSTAHVAVTARPTDTNKSRVVAAPILAGFVSPYVQGQLAEHAYSIITTVEDVNTTLAVGLTIPAAPTASPPGPGGGWLDGTPWPSVDGVTYFRVAVTAVASTTVFTVDAQTAPVAGVSQIAWLSPYEWKLYTATVSSFTGTAGAYVVTIDTPFVGIVTGELIWPQCELQEDYVAAVLAAFRLMGPGEKTTNASALVRGFRHPPTYERWPSSLGPHILRALESVDENAQSQFLYRSDGVTTVNGSSGVVEPQALLDADVEDPPRCFTPFRVALYQVKQ